MTSVYLIRAGESQYKIGITSNIYKRMSALQTSNGNKIELITHKEVDDAAISENSIHTSLAKYKAGGGREWFRLESMQAIELAIQINKLPQATDTDVSSLKELIDRQYLIQKKISAKLQRIIDMNPTKDLARVMGSPPPRTIVKKEVKEKPTIEQDVETAIPFIRIQGTASTSFLQRKLSIGYGRAARIIERLEEMGYVEPQNGIKPRKYIGPQLGAAERILQTMQ